MPAMKGPAKKVKPAPKPKPKPCKGDPHDLICKDINDWMKEMKKWGDKVTVELNKLIGTGGPGKVPPPPPPPFD